MPQVVRASKITAQSVVALKKNENYFLKMERDMLFDASS
jgi:hypothetical protein